MAMDAKDNGELNEHFDIEAVFFFRSGRGLEGACRSEHEGHQALLVQKAVLHCKQKKIGN